MNLEAEVNVFNTIAHDSTDARNGPSGRSGAAAQQPAVEAPKRGIGEFNFERSPIEMQRDCR